jgi:hypothetical protein
MDDKTQIAAPAAKAAAALTASAGTSAVSVVSGVESFLPTNLAGWLAAAASAAALLYTLTIMIEWWWKRVCRPLAVRRGWMKVRPGTHFQIDVETGTFERIEQP